MAAYRKLKQQDNIATIGDTTEKPETTGIIEFNHIYSSPSTVSSNH
jgi:hypothetical protein